MDGMTFPAKILKPLRITIPEAVGEALVLKPGDLVEVNIKKIKVQSGN
jgi:bifunctional DNA-binding transcriptional regulator/antitoxin component of YhaV-PrlF toxin-antitoxin module